MATQRCPSPRAPIPGSTRSLGHHLKRDARATLGGRRQRGGPCTGSVDTRITLLGLRGPFVTSHQEGKGRASGDPWLQHRFTPTAGAARSPGARQARQAVTRTTRQLVHRGVPGAPVGCHSRPQGGRPRRSRRGEGREPLGRLTPPTCAARSVARPQDLAHRTCGSNTSLCLTSQSPKQ